MSSIFHLLLPMSSGVKDNYGKEVVPPKALSFDRVNKGQPIIASDSPISISLLKS